MAINKIKKVQRREREGAASLKGAKADWGYRCPQDP